MSILRINAVTSKPEVFAVEILKHFGLYDYFSYAAGAMLDGSRIKKADEIKYALENCGITELNKVIMIGDREHDIIGAKTVGIDSIGALYGYGDIRELRNAVADFIAETVADVGKYVF